MAKIEILILEDKPLVADELAWNLEQIGYQGAVITHTADEAMGALKNVHVDLAILDVDLGKGRSGFEVGAFIQENIDIPFIYLTAMGGKQMIQQAAPTGPSAYLLKPYIPADLEAAIELSLYNFEAKQKVESEPVAKEKKKELLALAKHFFIRYQGRFVKVLQEDIQFAEANENYTKIVTADKTYTVSMNLKQFAAKVDHPPIKRTHRSYMANLEMVDSIEDNTLIIGNSLIPVSRSYREEIMQYFELL